MKLSLTVNDYSILITQSLHLQMTPSGRKRRLSYERPLHSTVTIEPSTEKRQEENVVEEEVKVQEARHAEDEPIDEVEDVEVKIYLF